MFVVFFSRYMANTETYLKNVALKHMPPNLQKVSLLKSGEYSQTLGQSQQIIAKEVWGKLWGACSVKNYIFSWCSVETNIVW